MAVLKCYKLGSDTQVHNSAIGPDGNFNEEYLVELDKRIMETDYTSSRIRRIIVEAKRILKERKQKIERSRPKHRPLHKFIYIRGVL